MTAGAIGVMALCFFLLADCSWGRSRDLQRELDENAKADKIQVTNDYFPDRQLRGSG